MYHWHVVTVSALPAHLRELRKAHRLKLKQVAEATGLSVSFLSEVEIGRSQPSLDTLQKLALVYGAEIVVSFEGGLT